MTFRSSSRRVWQSSDLWSLPDPWSRDLRASRICGGEGFRPFVGEKAMELLGRDRASKEPTLAVYFLLDRGEIIGLVVGFDSFHNYFQVE